MPRSAIVRGENVENVVEHPEGWEPGPGLVLVPLGPTDLVSPGDQRKAGKFTRRPPKAAPPDPLVALREDVDWLIVEVTKLGAAK